MNGNTKAAFFEFINEIEILAQGVVHQTGTDSSGGCSKLPRT